MKRSGTRATIVSLSVMRRAFVLEPTAIGFENFPDCVGGKRIIRWSIGVALCVLLFPEVRTNHNNGLTLLIGEEDSTSIKIIYYL